GAPFGRGANVVAKGDDLGAVHLGDGGGLDLADHAAADDADPNGSALFTHASSSNLRRCNQAAIARSDGARSCLSAVEKGYSSRNDEGPDTAASRADAQVGRVVRPYRE